MDTATNDPGLNEMGKTIEMCILDGEPVEDSLIRENFKHSEHLDNIVKAFRYSKSVFEEFGTTRSCGNPYLIHPYSVAKILQKVEAPEEAIIVGLLHDTLEEMEKNGRLEESQEYVSEEFGEHIENLVMAVSTDFGNGKSYAEKLKEMLDRSREIPDEKLRVVPLLVKLADGIDNIETIYTRRRDLYSEFVSDELGKESYLSLRDIDGKHYLNLDGHKVAIQNAVDLLNAVNSHFQENGKEYSRYSRLIGILYGRLMANIETQIENEIRCIGLEIEAIKTKNPGEYKKAILKGVFGEQNEGFLENYGYDLEKIQQMQELPLSIPIAMPRHKYVFSQIAKSKITEEHLERYGSLFGETLEKYKVELKGKLNDIRNIPKIRAN